MNLEPTTAAAMLETNYQWFCVERHPKSTKLNSIVCLYRGPNGLKCGIGCCLPDELYSPEIDQEDDSYIDNIMRQFPPVREYFSRVNKVFLYQLQELHDRPGNIEPDEYLKGLNNLAEEFGIDWHREEIDHE